MATSKQPVFTKFLWYFLDYACDPHPHPENLHDFIKYFDYFKDNYLDEGEDPCFRFDFDFSSWKSVDMWVERIASEGLTPELEEQLDAVSKEGHIIEEKNFSNYKKWLEESGIALVSVTMSTLMWNTAAWKCSTLSATTESSMSSIATIPMDAMISRITAHP